MDLYGRPPAPAVRRTPAVVFLNERLKAHSFSSGFTPPTAVQGHGLDAQSYLLVDHDRPARPQASRSNQQQQQQPHLLHQRPASTRFLNRPQSSGIRRPDTNPASFNEAKQRPRTARDGARTLPMGLPVTKRATCFNEDSEKAVSPEVDERSQELSETDGDAQKPAAASVPCLDERYLRQLKADILHLHHVHLQFEKDANVNGEGGNASLRATTMTAHAPNHVKNLLLNRESKVLSGWGSQRNMDLRSDPVAASSTASIHTQLLRYNYSSDSAQLTAAKIGLEAILAEKLTSLMEFCLSHDISEGSGGPRASTASKMELMRPPNGPSTPQQPGGVLTLPFAHGCGMSPVSIYAGGFISVLGQAEALKRITLASTGEKKLLVRAIADKDTQVSQLTEQIGFFKDVLARARPPSERSRRAPGPNQESTFSEDRCSSARAWNDADSGVSPPTVTTEQQTRLAALEQEKVESLASIHNLQKQNDLLSQQVENANAELQMARKRIESSELRHRELVNTSTKSFQDQMIDMEKQVLDLRSSLASASERYRTLETTAAQEKAQLRRDKQEMERLVRLKGDENDQRQVQAAARAERQAELAATQLKLVTQQLHQAQHTVADLRSQMKSIQTDNTKRQDMVESLQRELKTRTDEVTALSSDVMSSTRTAESRAVLLQQSEDRIASSVKELERQHAIVEQQANQLQLLEAQLSRSIPVDDDELQSRRQREESTWNQRVAALEHALVAERQNTALFRDQQQKAVVMAQENAAHAVEQAQAVAAELATANLCIAERKRQRQQEQQVFEQKTTEFTDRIAALARQNEVLELELGGLRCQHEELQQLQKRTMENAAATESGLHEELKVVKEELECLTEIREHLDRALAQALASPSKTTAIGTPRHQASLSEARVELQKAKQKIASLEDKLSRSDSSRAREMEGRLAQLSARERRNAEEQRSLKKQRVGAVAERQQLQKERTQLDQQRDTQTTAGMKQEEDHKLLQQIIEVLAQRLQVLMALFDTVPVHISSQTQSNSIKDCQPTTTCKDQLTPATPTTFSSNFEGEKAEKWRELQRQWEALRQELEDADWQLLQMRDRLEELHLEYVGHPLSPLQRPDGTEQRPDPQQRLSSSSILSGFNGPNPFSDAVAAGRHTVPVAEQLKSSYSLRRLSCPAIGPESRAGQTKSEEQETFAIALAKEMATMKESYEGQLETLQQELRATRKLRVETCQRLRGELTSERQRSQRAVAHFTECIAELEAALSAQEQALAAAQEEQIALLDKYAAAANEAARSSALRALADLVSSSCAEQQTRRESQRRDRLLKLHTYCGSSSVTVVDRERMRKEEAEEAEEAAEAEERLAQLQ